MTATAPQSIFDDATDYAKRVTSGEIVAGPHVRYACKRHINDLKTAPSRGFFYDLEKASRAIGFFGDVLCLNGGEFEGAPYNLLPWQRFIVGSLFGWVDKKGLRRFRVAYVETGKGSGKSPLAAGIGLYGMVADDEPRAEIYAAARKKDQAMILFRDAVAMVDQSPHLSKRLVKSGVGERCWNLAYQETGSFFKPLSSDNSQSGPRPHIVLLDEIHEHRDNRIIEMLRAGTKGRRQALIFMITNSGHDRTSACWDYHQYGIQAAEQQSKDDTFFSYICALDENDEPFKNKDCWPKANPSLGVTISDKYLQEQVDQAAGMPSKQSIVRRLNFCQWTEGDASWIGPEDWDRIQDDECTIEALRGRTCYAGLDLSSTTDLTSLVLLFEPTEADEYWRIHPYFWLPADGLVQKSDNDRVPYTTWRDAGWLETTPGRAINKRFVVSRLAEISGLVDLKLLSYDRWRINDFRTLLNEEGLEIEMHEHGQGYKDMSPSVEELERLILSNNIRFNNNPVMRWCSSNIVIETDPTGSRKFNKAKSWGRIDGMVASVMAVGASKKAVHKPVAGMFVL